MVSPNVNAIFRAAQSLSDAEQQELRSLLEKRANQLVCLTPEKKLRQLLVERGLLDKTPPAGKDQERFNRWRPIQISGKPISETIIEERR